VGGRRARGAGVMIRGKDHDEDDVIEVTDGE
jgi:hypothetical protein